MIDKSGIVQQTNLAFDFIQKLNLEVSYLIKEVEAMLSEEEERFERTFGTPGECLGKESLARSA